MVKRKCQKKAVKGVVVNRSGDKTVRVLVRSLGRHTVQWAEKMY